MCGRMHTKAICSLRALTPELLASKLNETKSVQSFQKSRWWRLLGWSCVLCLLLMNSVLATHVCSLSEDLHPHSDKVLELSSAVSGHTFCAICAISHSPLLAAPLVSLTSLQGPSETVSVPTGNRALRSNAIHSLYSPASAC